MYTDRILSPIQRMASIDGNTIYIKREDLLPFSFGGNKSRKAQLFFNEIDGGDYNCVVTYGSSSSNHCRVVSNMAAARNIKCCIISPEESAYQTFNSHMMNMFGAEITVVPTCRVHDTIEKKISELKSSGNKPYFIGGGGHGNIGTSAYVDCYNEIKEYEEYANVHFDYIFFASGTGTTQAGLVCGQLMYGDDRKIIGISIARTLPRGRDIVIESVSEYLKAARISVDFSQIEDKTVFIDEYVGGGYGKQNDNIIETIKDCIINYGIPLDRTYTGKAFWGMKDYLKKNSVCRANVLFIHTGGTPLFFDYLVDRTERNVNL